MGAGGNCFITHWLQHPVILWWGISNLTITSQQIDSYLNQDAIKQRTWYVHLHFSFIYSLSTIQFKTQLQIFISSLNLRSWDTFFHQQGDTYNTLMPYHTLFCSAGADPEHRGRGKQEDRRGGVSVLQAGSQLPWWKSKTTRDPPVPLYLLPRRAQKQQGPGSVSLLALIDLQGLWFVCLFVGQYT